MKKGFTLVELIIVIIIVGILASVAMGQYAKVVEKSREAEAKNILGSMRTAQIAYYVEYGEYLYELYTDKDLGPDTCFQTTHFFAYWCGTAGGCRATRCTGGLGKQPSIPLDKAYSIWLSPSGEFVRNGPS